MIRYLALTDDPRGLIVDDGARAKLTFARALDERSRLAEQALARSRDCRSMLRGNNEDLLVVLAARRSLAAWDHDHLFDGFILDPEPERDRWVHYVIGHDAKLPLLNLNASLHHRFVTGTLDASVFASSFAYVAHSREGFVHLRRRLDLEPRRWDPRDTTILVCPRGCPGVVPFIGDAKDLVPYLSAYPEAAVLPALVESFLERLRACADELGVDLRAPARSEDLFARLRSETDASQTLLLAHQHDGRIHFADRVVATAEVHEAARHRPEGGAWYLAVCGSDGPSGLASALQSRGRPFIVTGGPVSVMQDQLGFMIALLEHKLEDPALTFEAAIRRVQIDAHATGR